MQLNLARVRQCLKDFDFAKLFVEELGWDCYSTVLDVAVENRTYTLAPAAQKRGMVAYVAAANSDSGIPDYPTRRKIDHQVTKSAREHLLIFTDAAKTTQVWQWVKREPGKPSACREHTFHRDQPGDALVQKLQAIAFGLEEEATLTLTGVTGGVRAGFDIEKVTKRFYEYFQGEHAAFLKFLKGIPEADMQRWYVSVMLNRLMFIYFIQKKGFLDGNQDYLRDKLAASKARGKDKFYSDFLCPLFFEGFAKTESDRGEKVNKLLGKVPYLNGGLFLKHQIEELHGRTIAIADAAFERLFEFFDRYHWHLDERPLRKDNEINPDVLGYIFEKYINQKQMGAYYTKEDITGYISRNTVIPFLFDAACRTGVPPVQPVPVKQPDRQDACPTHGDRQDACPTHGDRQDACPTIAQRHLPHWYVPGATYFITFRLGDSLPAGALAEWESARAAIQKKTGQDTLEQRKLLATCFEAYLHAGHGACLLRDPNAADIVERALKYFDGQRYQLGDCVIMPNHVHLLVTPLPGQDLSSILHSWKSFTAKQINKACGHTGRVWQDESYDHIVRSEEELAHFCEYIASNPVTAGLKDGFRCRTGVPPVPAAPVRQPDRQDACPTFWRLLAADPDRYIYPAVRRGVIDGASQIIPETALPEFVRTGMKDPNARMFNRDYNLHQAVVPGPDGANLALPTETWREYIERRKRCLELRAKLARGEVRDINDLITLNLDIEQFAQDVIENCEGPELLRAFWHAIEQVTVLDPTCGSGAFLFAALNILETLYEACLDRMEVFEAECRTGVPPVQPVNADRQDACPTFRDVLDRVAKHPNRKYFIYKSIILNNLYGVDIMEEAVEICKLRLFLKLVAQVERSDQIEPLPDIDFNIRAGNTLVGFATLDDVRKTLKVKAGETHKLGFVEEKDEVAAIEEEARICDQAFAKFRECQTVLAPESVLAAKVKAELRKYLDDLNAKLNRYLAAEYGVHCRTGVPPVPVVERDRQDACPTPYTNWLRSHQPFHWFSEFYGIIARGGIDVIIGNPPYVEMKSVSQYHVSGYQAKECGDLYAYVLERSVFLARPSGRMGFIVPMSCFSVDGFKSLQQLYYSQTWPLFVSNWSGDAHPARLFEGVDKRLEIVLARKERRLRPAGAFAGKYLKWYTAERTLLFQRFPVYQLIDPMKPIAAFESSLPKLSSSLELAILGKLRSCGKDIGSLLCKGGNTEIYYTRKVSFFLQMLDFVPEVRDSRGSRAPSEMKILTFRDRQTSELCLACLSTSLFYWYNIINSDCRNLNKREIVSFPVPNAVSSETLAFLHKTLGELIPEQVR
ncbi:MAG: transposase [Planctomycetota bacterium]